MPEELTQPVEPRKDFFRSERDLAREQISAAWQIQVEKIQDAFDEALGAGDED